jgi:Ca-activated chloride channel family protein
MFYFRQSTLLFRLALAAILLTAGSVLAQEPEEKKPVNPDEITSIETNIVVLNVTVTDLREKYVAGLREKDFRIFEDRAPQKIVSFGFEETPFAAVILLDTSGSMTSRMSLARAACSSFVSGIREGDNVAIYSFGGTKVKMIQDFSEVRDVDPNLWETNAKGETPLYDAIYEAAEALAQRPEHRRAILIVSDGADTRSKYSLDDALKQTLLRGATIYSVNLTEAALHKTQPRDNGAEVLKSLAAKTGGRFYPAPGGSRLREAFADTIEELRNQYTIAYEPANEKLDGRWRVIEVQTSPAHTVRTRQGYYSARPKK